MDFEFDLDQMKKEREDALEKKSLMGLFGQIGQNMADAPTAADLMLGKKTYSPNIKGVADAAAGMIEDPVEKRAKLFQAYKATKEAEQLKNQSDDDKKMRDANSVFSQYARQRAKADGHQVDDSMSAYDIKTNFFDPKKMDEIRAQSDVEFNKQKRLKQIEFGQQSSLYDKKFQQDMALKQLENSNPGKAFDKLSQDKQELIKELSKKNANKIGIANQIDAVMSNWDSLTDDQKLAMGSQLLKTLNSPEGADAIGAEEAKRLGGKLQFAMGNFTNSNPTQFGRDLPGFKEQATLTSKGLKEAIKQNQKIVDEAYGGLNGTSPLYSVINKPEAPKPKKPSLAAPLIPTANANNNGAPTVVRKLRNPKTGKTVMILSDGTEIEE